MTEQEQIKKLAEMIDNCISVGDSSTQIAEMALTMAAHWNQDTKESAPEMYAMLELIKACEITGNVTNGWSEEIKELLTKARGEL